MTATDDTVEMVPTPPDRRVPERPVFVDASGRRQRNVRMVGRILVVPAVAYIGLLVSTLLGGPTINSPFLPLPAGPHAAHGVGRHSGTVGGGTNGSPAGTARATTGSHPSSSAAAKPSAGATAATPGATASATKPGAVHTHGKPTGAPPGASHHPTKKATAHA